MTSSLNPSERVDDTATADAIFPEVHRSRLHRERRGHEEFARTRRRAYVENPRVLARIDRYVIGEEEGEGPEDTPRHPLVITGDPGSGKSALLAHWSARFRVDHPGIPIISHFVGAGTFGSEMTALLHHLMHDLREQLDIQEAPTENAEELLDQFRSWLPWFRRGRFVIIVDALNQIRAGVTPEELLAWVPTDLPPTMRILLSTLEGPILQEIRSRDWNELRVEPLGEEERREVARRFIGGEERFSSIRSTQIRQIAGSSRSANPLFLRTSLEELRLLNHRSDPVEQTDDYLDADDLLALFDRILSRIEADFNPDRVSLALRMIEVSHTGMARDELADICGVTPAYIDRLITALDYQLIHRDGLYTFFHDHLRQAVRRRYVASHQSRHGALRRLGAYFRSRPVGERRAVEELHAWREAGRLDELRQSLCDLELTAWLWDHGHRYRLVRDWKDIRADQTISIEEAYGPALDELVASGRVSREETARYFERVGRLAFESGEISGAARLLHRGIDILAESPEESAHSLSLHHHYGIAIRDHGELSEAESVFLRVIPAAEAHLGEDAPFVGQLLDALGTVYYRNFEFDRALEVHRRAHATLRRHKGDDHFDTIQAEINVVACYQKLRRHDIIEELYAALIDRCTSALGADHAVIGTVLHNYAMANQDLDNHEQARDLLRQSYQIIRAIYGDDHVETASRLVGLGASERNLGNNDKAYELMTAAIAIFERHLTPGHPSLTGALTNMATLLSTMGRYRESEAYCRQIVALREEIHGPESSSTHRSRLNLSNTLLRQGRFEEAHTWAEMSTEAMIREYGTDHKWSKIWGERFVEILQALERHDEAEEKKKLWEL